MPEAARHVDCDGRTVVAPEGRAYLVLHRIVAVRNSADAFADPVRDAARGHEVLR
jgi:type IV pilus assembly protein PilW